MNKENDSQIPDLCRIDLGLDDLIATCTLIEDFASPFEFEDEKASKVVDAACGFRVFLLDHQPHAIAMNMAIKEPHVKADQLNLVMVNYYTKLLIKSLDGWKQGPEALLVLRTRLSTLAKGHGCQ